MDENDRRLTQILPETEKWGIDLIPSLLKAEAKYRWKIDEMLRLMAIVPPREEVVSKLASRLKLSGEDAARLLNWSRTAKISHDVKPDRFDRLLYENDYQAMLDVMALEIALLVISPTS